MKLGSHARADLPTGNSKLCVANHKKNLCGVACHLEIRKDGKVTGHLDHVDSGPLY